MKQLLRFQTRDRTSEFLKSLRISVKCYERFDLNPTRIYRNSMRRSDSSFERFSENQLRWIDFQNSSPKRTGRNLTLL
jgi:hypothetical protein